MNEASDSQAASTSMIDPEIMELVSAMPAVPARAVLPTSNLVLGLIAGVCAAVVVGFLWAIAVAITNFVFVYSAVFVGVAVGIAIRRFGKGTTRIYGIMGAVLSLIASILGNLFAVLIITSHDKGIPFFPLFMSVVSNPANLLKLVQIMLSSTSTLALCAIAAYTGYWLSIYRPRRISVTPSVEAESEPVVTSTATTGIISQPATAARKPQKKRKNGYRPVIILILAVAVLMGMFILLLWLFEIGAVH